MKYFSKLWHVLVNNLVGILSFILLSLTVTFIAIMIWEDAEKFISQLLGISEEEVTQKSEALKFLGIGMGGILLALQALASHTRAKAMEDTANAQAKATEQQATANQNVERGQRQERLKNAIEHLGHQSVSVRLGGAYELFHLAQDTEDLRQTVLDILCAHIRRTTGENEYRKKHKSEPSEEVQSLLILLFVQKHEVFKGLHINLRGSWLNGVDLPFARLEKAVLDWAYLRKAKLWYAHMQGAYLWGTCMHEAYLTEAYLQGANLLYAFLQGAYLRKAHLQGAYLGATRLQGAYLKEARLEGVISQQTFLPFEEQIRSQIGQESDFSGVIFAGGLSQEDLDYLANELTVQQAQQLREKLMPHVGKPESHQLPENSGAITGAYSAEEAEEWIAEYRKAMLKEASNS